MTAHRPQGAWVPVVIQGGSAADPIAPWEAELLSTRPTVVRALPPMWDGVPVQWSDLAVTGGSLDLHLPPRCGCGSHEPPWRAGGTVLLGRDPRTGREARVLALYAQRCRACLHDVVYDERSGESWDLGPEDYGAEGSSAIEGSLW